MIKEDYVFFEVAKLLKEKGFNEGCFVVANAISKGVMHVSSPTTNSDVEDDKASLIALPTLQMAMKWLREEKHYYIQIMLDSWVLGDHCGFYVVIQKTDSDFRMMLADAVDNVFYETYEIAANVALRYVLKELI